MSTSLDVFGNLRMGAHQLGRLAAFELGHLLDRALYLLDINGLAADLDGRLEYLLDLAQLVGVACDEVDVIRHDGRGANSMMSLGQ